MQSKYIIKANLFKVGTGITVLSTVWFLAPLFRRKLMSLCSKESDLTAYPYTSKAITSVIASLPTTLLLYYFSSNSEFSINLRNLSLLIIIDRLLNFDALYASIYYRFKSLFSK